MKILLPIALACASLTLACHASAGDSAAQPAFAQPGVSPDGSEIAFAADGAIWIVPASGGAARLLVADSATDSRPLFSPDGKRLAFESDKTGNGDIYVLDFASGALKRLTWSDAGDEPSGWSRDGEWIYFTSARDNIAHLGAVYRVRVSGGTPMPVSLELYRNEEAGIPSPDGKTIALVGEGWGSTQWWRHGHAHIDESAIWLLKNDGTHDYRRITPDTARALWPMWATDGKSLYYMSDRSGTENIWQTNTSGGEKALTHFTSGRCLWPSVSADGKTIAFQRGFGIWTLDTASGKTQEVPITLGGAVGGPGIEHKTFNSDYSELALSPDGKKIAFIVHGEVFAAAAGKPGPAEQITHSAAAEFGLVWAPDSRRIVYASERDGANHLFLYDFANGKKKRLTDSAGNDGEAQFSPDGKSVAFIRDAKSLEVLNLADGKLREIASGELDLHHPLESTHPFAWSPDGRWVAFLAWGARMYRNVEIVSAAGGKARSASFLGNTFSDSLQWSPDGKTLYFSTGERTEPGRIAQVDLVPRTPEFREQKFLDLFTEETPPGVPNAPSKSKPPHAGSAGKAGAKAKKPVQVKIAFTGIANRLELLPVGLDVQSVAVSPDGKMLLLTAEVAGRSNLYTWSLDPLALKAPVGHQITATAGDKSAAQFSHDGKTVWYLDGGRIYSVPVKGGGAKALAVSASMDIDFAAVKEAAFHEVWQWLADNFHDPKMNGVDWKAVHTRYAPLVAGAATPATLQRLLNRMVGELDSSHSGVRDGGHHVTETGRLGLRFDPAVFEKRGGFKVSVVIPLGPAAVTGKIAVGDYLVAVDGTPLDRDRNLDALLANRIGRETTLTVADNASGLHRREVKVKPVDSGTISQLVYQAWVEHNREMVAKLSGGKLGYVQLPDMSMQSLERLYRAIDAQNGTREGVVIDVRNNYGGFVNAYALDAIVRRHYLNMTFRGMATASARPVLGQRALERPTVLITNRVTLSDGEDFTEGYRELGLGKVVGEPTAGWIIYTSNVPLINDFTVRLPFITITTADGKPMEMHPRPVDVPVAEPLGESYRGKDARLAAAVQVLMEQISGKSAR
ncbi:MAG: S41 family peptidase [Gammaproteobacteria bacterium]